VNGIPSSAGAGGLTLGTVVLGVEKDIVSLLRRVRAAGEEFGLDRRDTRRLSAAIFEAARLLVAAYPGACADILLADGPSIGVVFRVPDGGSAAGVRALEELLAPVRPLVPRFDIAGSDAGALVSLGIPLRSRGAALPPPAGVQGVPDGHGLDLLRECRPAKAPGDPAQLGEDLQRELVDANRGLVDLYAELDEQAGRLRLADDELRLLLESVQDYAICMLDPEGLVTSWNAGAERLFGFSAEEIIGRSFTSFYLVPERNEGIPAAHLVAADAAERLECEGLRLRRGGPAFDAHVVLTAVRDMDRRLRGFSLVVRDITERKRLEDDLRRRAEELAAANRAKEDFLATLSHELRTPLNAMLGWTRLLQMGKLDAAGIARALETIERNAHLQEQLIADILDVSRIITGKLRLELKPTELDPLIAGALDAVRPAANAKGVALRLRTESGGTVLADVDRLQQVIWNLLVNAIKFTPADGSVHVAAVRQGPMAVITVADTGEGIAPELLPFVFDRFRQGDASVTRPHGGLGLGLSIVRHIVELHGGKVQVESNGTGQGATFAVLLPLRTFRSPDDPAAARASEED
jgi:PAS domain S-box-containing protein